MDSLLDLRGCQVVGVRLRHVEAALDCVAEALREHARARDAAARVQAEQLARQGALAREQLAREKELHEAAQRHLAELLPDAPYGTIQDAVTAYASESPRLLAPRPQGLPGRLFHLARIRCRTGAPQVAGPRPARVEPPAQDAAARGGAERPRRDALSRC